MTDGALIALATFLDERNDFRTAEVFDDLQGDFCAFDVRGSDLQFGTIGEGENFIDDDGFILGNVKEFEIETVTGLDTVLFSAGFNNCVCLHGRLFLVGLDSGWTCESCSRGELSGGVNEGN